jgi:hypothetical protein
MIRSIAFAIIVYAALFPEVLVANNQVSDAGVIERFDFNSVDDLLRLDQLNVKLVIFPDATETTISSAHLALFRQWIRSGGIAYFYQEGLLSSLSEKLALVRPSERKVRKESGSYFDYEEGVGELFVKDILPSVRIHNHELTSGVSSLYVGPSHGANVRFIGPREGSEDITPILSMGPVCVDYQDSSLKQFQEILYRYIYINKGYGNCNDSDDKLFESYPVMASVSLGEGMLVFDGTGLMAGKNSFNGSTYDWEVFYENILSYGPQP